MTLAKGLGGGLPIGACVTSPEYADVLEAGDHGSTFAGGPVPCAAAHAVLDVVDGSGFLAEVERKGHVLAEGLERLGLAVRGRGLMLAFAHEGAPALVRSALLDQHLVLNAIGPDTVRLLPPLTVSDAEIEDALGRIAKLLGR
jgi:acetylornithine/succinyldiaminopimelate/putrescine aminotransferase